MDASDDNSFGARACAEFAAFVASNLNGEPPPDAQGAVNGPGDLSGKLIFAIDQIRDGLDRFRAALTDEVTPNKTSADDESAIHARGLGETLQLIVDQILSQPEIFSRHYAQFASEVLRITRQESTLAPARSDFRFRDALWEESNFYRVLMQIYLAWCRFVEAWLDDQRVSVDDRRRIAFFVEQCVAALAPSNLPLNPSALRRAESSEGESVVAGLEQWLDDLRRNQGMPRHVREDAFAVGCDLGVTAGHVVYRNEVAELIQYTPQSARVRERPILIVPPQINKFYIFDLQPKNSIVAHLLQSDLQVFTISWYNPTQAEAHWNLDTYVKATLEAIDVVREITGSEQIGMISACAGGLTAMATMGYLASIDDQRVANHSLLVTCLFPNYGSSMEMFATPTMIERVRNYSKTIGLMNGKELAHVFFWLRPNDLVWRYWVNNYLLGRTPPSLDVLFWDNDSTRLPGALHGDFLDMFAHDVFQHPNRLRVLGHDIDFAMLNVDSYVVGGEDDYLMPWQGCYRAYECFSGDNHFVLSTSGHVQSILRPPTLARTAYYTNPDKSAPTATDWLAGTTRHDGSWWGHWHAWLNEVSGRPRAAPRRAGSPIHPAGEPAPGIYVMG